MFMYFLPCCFIFVFVSHCLPEWCFHQRCPSGPAVWDSRTHHWRGSRGLSLQAGTCSEMREGRFHTELFVIQTLFIFEVSLPWWGSIPAVAHLLSLQSSPAGCGSFSLQFPSYSLLMGSGMSFPPFRQEFLKETTVLEVTKISCG